MRDDAAVSVNKHGDRDRGCVVVAAGHGALVEQDLEGVTGLRNKVLDGRLVFVQVDGQDDEAAVLVFLIHFFDVGHFAAAWRAPCCEEVDVDGLAFEVAQRDVVAIEVRKSEIRGQRKLRTRSVRGAWCFACRKIAGDDDCCDGDDYCRDPDKYCFFHVNSPFILKIYKVKGSADFGKGVCENQNAHNNHQHPAHDRNDGQIFRKLFHPDRKTADCESCEQKRNCKAERVDEEEGHALGDGV